MAPELFEAVLSMDAYNRGYEESIILNNDLLGPAMVEKIQVDGLMVDLDSGILRDGKTQERLDTEIGFYAVAYDYYGHTIIAYRGTDYPQSESLLYRYRDVIHGWTLGGGATSSQQGRMAADFFNAVAQEKNNGIDINPLFADISLTGHSLGGGLGGFVGAMYHKDATVFDSMTFKEAINVAYGTAKDEIADTREAFYGGREPWEPNFDGINGHYIENEALVGLRRPGELISMLPWTDAPLRTTEHLLGEGVVLDDESENAEKVARHSMSTLVMRLFAHPGYSDEAQRQNWLTVATSFWPVLYDDDFAQSIGFDSEQVSGQLQLQGQYADILRMALAYSVIDKGSYDKNGNLIRSSIPFGDTAVRAFYDDMNDLGKAIQSHSGTPFYFLNNYNVEICKTAIENAGKLALNKVLKDQTPEALSGVFRLDDPDNPSQLIVDLSEKSWLSEDGQSLARNISGGELVSKLLGVRWGMSKEPSESEVGFAELEGLTSLVIDINGEIELVSDATIGGSALIGSDADNRFLIDGLGSNAVGGSEGFDEVSYGLLGSDIEIQYEQLNDRSETSLVGLEVNLESSYKEPSLLCESRLVVKKRGSSEGQNYSDYLYGIEKLVGTKGDDRLDLQGLNFELALPLEFDAGQGQDLVAFPEDTSSEAYYPWTWHGFHGAVRLSDTNQIESVANDLPVGTIFLQEPDLIVEASGDAKTPFGWKLKSFERFENTRSAKVAALGSTFHTDSSVLNRPEDGDYLKEKRARAAAIMDYSGCSVPLSFDLNAQTVSDGTAEDIIEGTIETPSSEFASSVSLTNFVGTDLGDEYRLVGDENISFKNYHYTRVAHDRFEYRYIEFLNARFAYFGAIFSGVGDDMIVGSLGDSVDSREFAYLDKYYYAGGNDHFVNTGARVFLPRNITPDDVELGEVVWSKIGSVRTEIRNDDVELDNWVDVDVFVASTAIKIGTLGSISTNCAGFYYSERLGEYLDRYFIAYIEKHGGRVDWSSLGRLYNQGDAPFYGSLELVYGDGSSFQLGDALIVKDMVPALDLRMRQPPNPSVANGFILGTPRSEEVSISEETYKCHLFGGDDRVFSPKGSNLVNVIDLGPGNDLAIVEEGNIRLVVSAGSGDDEVVIKSAGLVDRVELGSGDDKVTAVAKGIYAGPGDDLIQTKLHVEDVSFQPNRFIDGGSGDDELVIEGELGAVAMSWIYATADSLGYPIGIDFSASADGKFGGLRVVGVEKFTIDGESLDFADLVARADINTETILDHINSNTSRSVINLWSYRPLLNEAIEEALNDGDSQDALIQAGRAFNVGNPDAVNPMIDILNAYAQEASHEYHLGVRNGFKISGEVSEGKFRIKYNNRNRNVVTVLPGKNNDLSSENWEVGDQIRIMPQSCYNFEDNLEDFESIFYKTTIIPIETMFDRYLEKWENATSGSVAGD